MKTFFLKNWPLLATIGIGLIVLMIFFKPQLEGMGLKQHDVESWKGMSNETDLYRVDKGVEPLWTSSAFGGMPTEQISVMYPGNWFKTIVNQYFKLFPVPFGSIFLHFLCFLLFARFLKINPWIGLVGALAFSFSSYELIVVQAGHVTKSIAVASLPAVLGAFIYAFRSNKRLLGITLFGLFFTIQLAANHLQITYYFFFVLLFVGIYFLVLAFQTKAIKEFFITSAGIILVSLLALAINSGNIVLTNDYAKHTIRSKNDITISPNGEESKIQSGGLDKDYITQWSYGIGETFTLISPYVKGGASEKLGDSPFADNIDNGDYTNEEANAIKNGYSYWGTQPITSGPVYIGIVVVMLAFLGLFFMKDKIKWPLFVVTILAIALSWGKNFMGLTNFFIDHVPGYDKFRAVTIILIIVELTIPVLGVLFLNYLLKERSTILTEKKKLFIVSGCFIFFLIVVRFVGLNDSYSNAIEVNSFQGLDQQYTQQLLSMDPAQVQQNYGVDVRNPQQLKQFIDLQVENQTKSFAHVKEFRKSIFNSSMNRSIIFSILLLGVLYMFIRTNEEKTAQTVLLTGVVLLTLFDMLPVAYNYLGSKEDAKGIGYKYWEEKGMTEFPIAAMKSDSEIMNHELEQSPPLKSLVAAAEQKAKREADEKGYEGVSRLNFLNSHRFQALKLATNYRVLDLTTSFSNSSRASYFHKSIGGYHGAKLRNIQNLIEFQLANTNNNVMNMLNIKYIIQQNQVTGADTAIINHGALGNAWLVKTVKSFDTPNNEIRALGSTFALENKGIGQLLINRIPQKEAVVYGLETIQYFIPGKDTIPVRLSNGMAKGQQAMMVMDINGSTNLVPLQTIHSDTSKSFTSLVLLTVKDAFDPANEVVMLDSEKDKLGVAEFSGQGTISMTSFAPNKITYSADVKGNQLAVFSEIYYPNGWKAFVDGKEQEVLKVDYLLRGLKLEDGKHKIEFVYDLPKFHTMNTIAGISSFVMLCLIGFSVFVEWKRGRK